MVKKRRRVALIDVCDVVADLRRTALRTANVIVPDADITGWDLFTYISEDDSTKIIKLFNDPEFWRELPPIDDAMAGIEGIQRQGFEIHWLTSPWHTCENWEGVRRAWLFQHFKTDPSDITFTAQKFRVSGDIFIDDRPEHVERWQSYHPNGEALLFSSRFNAYFDWQKRCLWDAAGFKLCI